MLWLHEDFEPYFSPVAKIPATTKFEEMPRPKWSGRVAGSMFEQLLVDDGGGARVAQAVVAQGSVPDCTPVNGNFPARQRVCMPWNAASVLPARRIRYPDFARFSQRDPEPCPWRS
jgi:hypothetical protein